MGNKRPSTGTPPLRLVHSAESGASTEAVDARRDDALVRAFLAGDSTAFRDLVRRHSRLIYRLVRRYAQSAADAQDLTQNVFLRAFRATGRAFSRPRTPGLIPFRAWLVRIALNIGKGHVRRKSFLLEVHLPDDEMEESATSVDAIPVDLLLDAERQKRVRAAASKLPRRQREVFTLRIDGELPFIEIADALGITENNAKVLHHLAMKRLREAFALELQENQS